MLILLGLRAAGKSTLAPLLAPAFVDLDDRTAALLGQRRAGDALAAAGELAFRAAELRALTAALREQPNVLALGGGTATIFEARALLERARAEKRARIIYLHARPEELARRAAADTATARPALTDAPTPIEDFERLYAARDALYAALADQVIDTEHYTPAQIAAQLQATPNS